MFEILRNMSRRRVRTGLTLFGIVIGIFALTVMGSMSEYFNTLLDNAITQAGTNIGISTKGGFQSQLTESQMRRIERVPGVRAVIPSVFDTLGELGAVQFGTPDLVVGEPPEFVQFDLPAVTLKRGRWLQRGDTYHAVIGSKIASKKKLDLGGTIQWRDHDFTVVGIMNETQTSPDVMVIVPLDIARRLLKQPTLISSMSVVPQDPREVNALAKRIQAAVDEVKVQTPQDAVDQVRQGLVVFNVILLSGAVLAVVVGGLAVINTMIMSVNERTREIGLKKAIGASDGEIVKEYVMEAAVIGLFGGLIGIGLGTLMANLLNTSVAQALGGTEIFTVTPRLAVIALTFAVVLGAGAGLYPAWNAARLDPVKALRSE
jgi:putative ABC transport system permease protein